MSFFRELKRRNVIRVGAAYLVVAWLVIQVAETLFPLFGFDETPARIVVILLAIGLLPTLVFSWAFELTAEGLKRTHEVDVSESLTPSTGKKLDRMIMVVLALAVGYFAFDKFVLSATRQAVIAEQARLEGRSQALVESYGDKSIAVLAFEDMSPGGDQEYFSDGIAEELLNLLARIPDLRVISRSSAFSYKGKDIKLDQVARELNVAHILEGSVRKAGNQVRITAQLIEARSDTHLWSETYDRALDDIFAVQDEIAAKVVEKLKITLLGETPHQTETDPELYSLFLQGRHLRRQLSEDGLDQAQELLEQVVEGDPKYLPALDDLITVYINQVHTGTRDFDQGYRLGLELALRGLKVDPEFGRLYAQLGWIEMFYSNDLQAAASSFERGLALAPDDPSMLGDTATLLYVLGRIDEALRLNERVCRMDPLLTAAWLNQGNMLAAAERWEESVSAYRTALRLSPETSELHYYLAMSLLGSGSAEEALKVLESEPNPDWQLLGKAMIYPVLGLGREADEALAGSIETGAFPVRIAEVFAVRGEFDEAFQWLEKAIATGDVEVAQIHVNPQLRHLKSDARWLPLLERLGKSPEQLEAIKFKLPVQVS